MGKATEADSEAWGGLREIMCHAGHRVGASACLALVELVRSGLGAWPGKLLSHPQAFLGTSSARDGPFGATYVLHGRD